MITTLTMPTKELKQLGLTQPEFHYQLAPEVLVEQAVNRGQGVLNDTGALCINTGEFTGRSPLDKFTVKDEMTADSVHWNNFNIPVEEKYFFQLKEKMLNGFWNMLTKKR